LKNGGAEEPEESEEDEIDMYEIFEESPDLEIPYDLIAELELLEAKAEAGKQNNQASINKANINAAVAKWQLHKEDFGSAEVQIVIANEKIKYLTKHLLSNKKDKAAMRGLDCLVNLRRKFLNYLYKHNQSKAEAMVVDLGIRFRAPGQVWDKESKYRAFKNTKSKWLKIRAEKKALRKPTSA
jgi:small subunit ribosomal protein S15